MPADLIINCCVNGMIPTRASNPHTAITPDEIVREVAGAHELGATIAHIHGRGPDEHPTWDPGIHRAIFEGIREQAPDMIISATTSGRLWSEQGKRAAVLMLEGEARPDMASLTLGSMNFPKQASVNDPDTVRYLLDVMNANGILPELEVFDLGMIDTLRRLMDGGHLRTPYYVNLLLGNRGTLDAGALNLALMVDRLPAGGVWAACGIGKTQFAMNSLAIVMGGHVRVGIEDNLYLDHATKAPASNEELIRRVLVVARSVNREPMPSREVRERLMATKKKEASRSGALAD